MEPVAAEAAAPSKSQQKRAMAALQDLGAALLRLSPAQQARIPLPAALEEALTAARHMTKHEARRRQLQFIGRLMRDVDPAPIQAGLDRVQGISSAAQAVFHQLETWREAFMTDTQALTTILPQLIQWPDLTPAGQDALRQQLRQLRRNALAEAAAQKPPRSYREIFRLLRDHHTPAQPHEEAS